MSEKMSAYDNAPRAASTTTYIIMAATTRGKPRACRKFTAGVSKKATAIERSSKTRAWTNCPRRRPQANQAMMPIQMILTRMSRVRCQLTFSMPFVPLIAFDSISTPYISITYHYFDRFQPKVQAFFQAVVRYKNELDPLASRGERVKFVFVSYNCTFSPGRAGRN